MKLEVLIVILILGIPTACYIVNKASSFRRCNGYGRIFKKEHEKKNVK
jgi:hypothetical protein